MTQSRLKPSRRRASMLALAIAVAPVLPAATRVLNPVGTGIAATPQNPCAPASTPAKPAKKPAATTTKMSAKPASKTAAKPPAKAPGKKPSNPCAP